MQKILLIVLFLSVFLGQNSIAQVSINEDGSAPHSTAMLDVKSTNKGLLIPRMTTAEIEEIYLPADGLQVYNTETGKLYIFVENDFEWKEVNYAPEGIHPNATYSIGTGGSCNNTVVHGPYYASIVLEAYNFITLEVMVYTLGQYFITTNSTNGYSFTGDGVFNSIGIQNVNLYGYGFPSNAQTDSFIAYTKDSSSVCTFEVVVEPTPTIPEVYNSTTEEIWMDRNLGALQVALIINDTSAYGDLYQWGRAPDGHEKRTSDTTTTKATSAVPFAGNFWDGKFIATFGYDWLETEDNTLWQGVNGTNNPCPNGFRLPTLTELTAEKQSWTSGNTAGAFNSPLKLTPAGRRNKNYGVLGYVGTRGFYLSSTISGYGSVINLIFWNNHVQINGLEKAGGSSVRCIKD